MTSKKVLTQLVPCASLPLSYLFPELSPPTPTPNRSRHASSVDAAATVGLPIHLEAVPISWSIDLLPAHGRTHLAVLQLRVRLGRPRLWRVVRPTALYRGPDLGWWRPGWRAPGTWAAGSGEASPAREEPLCLSREAPSGVAGSCCSICFH